jgi:hypothetical protein
MVSCTGVLLALCKTNELPVEAMLADTTQCVQRMG